MEPQKKVTIIIPTHGQRKPKNILVNIDKRKNKIIIINDKYSKGPSWARNQGLKKADTPLVLFLDSDVHITQKDIDIMVNYIKNVDIVFPFIEFEDGTPYFPSNRYDKPTFPGLGACYMCKRKSLIDNNLFMDENYILNFEETDLFIRAEQAGLKCKYIPQIKAIHEMKDGNYHFILDKRRYYLEWRNYLYARWKLKKYLKSTKVNHALHLKYILLFIYRVIFKTSRIKQFKVKSLIKKYSRFYLLYLLFKGYFEFLLMKRG